MTRHKRRAAWGLAVVLAVLVVGGSGVLLVYGAQARGYVVTMRTSADWHLGVERLDGKTCWPTTISFNCGWEIYLGPLFVWVSKPPADCPPLPMQP